MEDTGCANYRDGQIGGVLEDPGKFSRVKEVFTPAGWAGVGLGVLKES